MFSIDSRSRMAIYEQLVQNIIGLIARGVLQPDDQLPSVRNLARDLGINPNTVQKAYQELEAKGMIYQAAGPRKLYCAGRVADRFDRAAKAQGGAASHPVRQKSRRPEGENARSGG